MTEMFGEAWSPMSVPDLAPDDDDDDAQRRCTFTLERNADFGRRAMLLNAENSGIPAATQKLIYTFVVHTTPRSRSRNNTIVRLQQGPRARTLEAEKRISP